MMSSSPATCAKRAGSPAYGASRRCSRNCACRPAAACVGAVSSTTRAVAGAWRPSTSPASRSPFRPRSACWGTARPRSRSASAGRRGRVAITRACGRATRARSRDAAGGPRRRHGAARTPPAADDGHRHRRRAVRAAAGRDRRAATVLRLQRRARGLRGHALDRPASHPARADRARPLGVRVVCARALRQHPRRQRRTGRAGGRGPALRRPRRARVEPALRRRRPRGPHGDVADARARSGASAPRPGRAGLYRRPRRAAAAAAPRGRPRDQPQRHPRRSDRRVRGGRTRVARPRGGGAPRVRRELAGSGDNGVTTSATRLKRARRARTRAQPLIRRSSRGPGPKRVAIVTGAARGIGAATVQELVRDGWAVVAVDRATDDRRLPYPLATEEELHALIRERVEVLAGDAASEAVLREAVAVAEERFEGLDAFVSAAGVIAGGAPLWEMPAAEVEAVLEVDLLAV